MHPELLDRLAHEFVDGGWNTKQIMKLIVTSRTYQQASVVRSELIDIDPNNRLYARQSAFRLPAEMVRDNALSISGLLDFPPESLRCRLASVLRYTPPR